MPFNKYINAPPSAAVLNADPTLIGNVQQQYSPPAQPVPQPSFSPLQLPNSVHRKGPSESMLLLGAAGIMLVLYLLRKGNISWQIH